MFMQRRFLKGHSSFSPISPRVLYGFRTALCYPDYGLLYLV
jgi:hypothetical protein